MISAAIIEVKRSGRGEIALINYNVLARFDGSYLYIHPPPYPTIYEDEGYICYYPYIFLSKTSLC